VRDANDVGLLDGVLEGLRARDFDGVGEGVTCVPVM
jgi:hypothetical protein